MFQIKKETPVNALYSNLSLLPVPYLHETRFLTLIHRCIYHSEDVPDIFVNRFTVNRFNSKYLGRRLNDLVVPFCKTVTGQRHSQYLASKLWNCLPENVKCLQSSSLFVKNVNSLYCKK